MRLSLTSFFAFSFPLLKCSSEEPESMNGSPEEVLKEQEKYSASEVVELIKPSVLTFPYSPENPIDKEEKLSPQSVLDPAVGQVNSPGHKTLNRGIELQTRVFFFHLVPYYNLNCNRPKNHVLADELSMPISRVLFKEFDASSASLTLCSGPEISIFDDKDTRVSFIKAVLEASELLSEEHSQVWYTEEPLLDVSVLAEVGNSYCLTDDAVLLFDCVEEVLLMIRDRFFGISPWVAFLKRNVRPAPVGRHLVEEVAKGIDSLVGNEFPNTLEHVMMKDLDSGSWLDLRYDSDSVVVELWDGLLDDLLEEMIFDLWL